ncbi:helix-turn-helix transcriptional regulator [Paenibacillus sp. GCM10027629]|uniref:helix-turn-helix transcriptional regulator n=1 Tax=Paenibacillus sp. GCM10027629 TaxID=3273414 RepID=UPI00363584B9
MEKKEQQYKVVNFIREYRKKLNITQEQIATKLDVSPTFINKIENGGKTPSLTLAFLILEAMKDIYSDDRGLYLELRFDDVFSIAPIQTE